MISEINKCSSQVLPPAYFSCCATGGGGGGAKRRDIKNSLGTTARNSLATALSRSVPEIFSTVNNETPANEPTAPAAEATSQLKPNGSHDGAALRPGHGASAKMDVL